MANVEMDPHDSASDILTDEALQFVVDLVEEFGPRRDELLLNRRSQQRDFDTGRLPDFLSQTQALRDAEWKVAPIPHDILDRRVEITGPASRKMIINALNSGACVFMADFEDSLSPTWNNIIEGQRALRDAVHRQIDFTHPSTGKAYHLCDDPAVLFVRPRGLHLPESHLRIGGAEVPASLFDFGIFFFHNAREQVRRGTAPYFYLPKLEHYLEARWWNDVFVWAQHRLKISTGTVRATVLIETLPAAFQMDEILYELRIHSAGLNCGRWDYIFSCIKTLKRHPNRIFPDRDQIGMTDHCMESYSRLLVQTCHRRGIHAMGGMAAQIPIKDDPEAHSTAMDAVEEDKLREVRHGHDGTWVAHPGLVRLARRVFDENMKTPNQIATTEEGETVTRNDLLSHPEGTITNDGLRYNTNVGVLYLESWLRGRGCVPLYNLMEDAATAEISRTQVWQWLHCGKISREHFKRILNEELRKIRTDVGNLQYISGKYEKAAKMFEQLSISNKLVDFLTLPAYRHIN
jgi:malate synthase